MTTTRDGGVATRSAETVAVAVGEPSPDLFRIPTDYVERSPSEWQGEVAKFTGQDCLNCNYAVADAVYNKHREP
jgi:hypothetical protein